RDDERDRKIGPLALLLVLLVDADVPLLAVAVRVGEALAEAVEPLVTLRGEARPDLPDAPARVREPVAAQAAAEPGLGAAGRACGEGDVPQVHLGVQPLGGEGEDGALPAQGQASASARRRPRPPLEA